MQLYLSGPMRGFKDLNRPRLNEFARLLRERGHDVRNPAKNDPSLDLPHALSMDLDWICTEAEGVVVLPAWRGSTGSCAEVAKAIALGIPVWPIAAFMLDGKRAVQVIWPGTT